LFGFFKAFGISEFNAISQPISKTMGILWILGFVFLAITALLLINQYEFWWVAAIIAVLMSQFLIINHWTDTKFGTIANVIMLLAIIIGYANFSFKTQIKSERTALFENSKPLNTKKVTKDALSDLPPIVHKWLTNSGIVDKPMSSNVYLVQELQLKMKPEQTEWNSGKAEQYFTVQPPAFHWSISTQMNSVLKITGRDKFEHGHGEMSIKLFSLIPVANAKDDKKVNQATLQRYLAEIVWFPSAALSPYITWEPLDDYSAKATMEYKGTVGTGEFHFDENGNFKKFVTLRYQDSNAVEPKEWTVRATKTEERHGIKIPVECEASWELENDNWTWLKLKIRDIHYNVKEIPVPDNASN
jgi:hypothetical protein